MLTDPPRTRRFVRSDPDERLVKAVRAGDRDAFEEIYERHAPGLVSFCRHLLGSLEEAEDAVQHTFLAAHKAMLADDRELHLKAWLYAIARNRCMSMLRSRRERPGLDDELEASASTAGLAAEVEQREDLRALLHDLAKLPDDQRAALLLAELGAHTHDEIAEVLDVRRDKVKALVFQAREGLIAARDARETPCEEIREQLSTARGGALRRGNLRRHLDECPGCRAFRDDVQRQRAALAILLPVAPSLALKQAVLGGAAATAAGLGAGATSGGLGAASGAKAAATKVLAAAALAGGAGGTGYVAVHELHHAPALPAVTATAEPTRLSDADAQPATAHVAVVQTASVTETPLRPAHAAPRAAGARHRHHARPHAAAPATETAALVTPAPTEAHPGRHHGHDHGRGHGRGADAPRVLAGRRQPDELKPSKPSARPVVDEHGRQGDDGHDTNKEGDRKAPDKLKRQQRDNAPATGDGNQGDNSQGGQGAQGGGGDGGDGRLILPPLPISR